jgi:ADP-heptose:LPS heptosyltransferase
MKKTALVVRDAAMGDVLFTEPFIRALARDGWSDIQVQTSHADLFLNHPNVVGFNPRVNNFDKVFYLDNTYEKECHTGKSIIDSYLDLYDMQLPESEKMPRVFLTESEIANAKTWFPSPGKWVAVCPVNRHDFWGWDEGRTWTKLVTALQQRGLKAVVLSDAINARIENADLDLRQKTTLRQVMALLANCNYILSIGGGMKNLAQAMDIPGVALYRPETPFLALMPNSGIIPIHLRDMFGVRLTECTDEHIEKIIRYFDFWLTPRMLRSPNVELGPTINQLVKDYGIQNIVETGAYNGMGSTIMFAKTGLPVRTIECNISHVKSCRENLKDYDVAVYHGLSLPKERLMNFIKDDYDFYVRAKKFGLQVDVEPDEAIKFYTDECDHDCPDNILPKLLEIPGRQLVFLDSAGGVGYAEFLEVSKYHDKLVVFDDVDHVKHFRSMKWFLAHSIEFHLDERKRTGWAYLP